jgi:hypothetical protein
MSDTKTQRWPTERVQRQLRPDEALIEMVRAERVFLANREQLGIPEKNEPIRRLVGLKLGLKARK